MEHDGSNDKEKLPPAWSCSRCTYQHVSPQEQAFLVCSVCNTPRDGQRMKQKRPAFVSNSKNAKRTKLTQTQITSTLEKRRGLGKATESNNRVAGGASTSETSSENSFIENNAELNGQSTRPFGATTDCVIAASDKAKARQTNAFSPGSTIASAPRSVLEALKPQPSSSFIHRARYRDFLNDPWKTATDEVLPQICPLAIVRNVLPKATAARLLDQLEADSSTWNRGNWIIHGKSHLIPRTTATYYLQTGNNHRNGNQLEEHESDTEDDYHDSSRRISNELREAADCVVTAVKRLRPSWNQDWQPTFAFANRYTDGAECVSWHSDHLMTLGPRPIIVGLTLGACRKFELREQQPPTTPSTHSKNSSSRIRHVSLPLPHNSLVVMWNDAQESWHHCVPRCSNDSIQPHPSVGLVRISLTFRMKRSLPNLGNCFCGRPAALKSKSGRYFLFCRPYGEDKHKTCNFWKPCPWAEEEAARLMMQEREATLASEANTLEPN